MTLPEGSNPEKCQALKSSKHWVMAALSGYISLDQGIVMQTKTLPD